MHLVRLPLDGSEEAIQVGGEALLVLLVRGYKKRRLGQGLREMHATTVRRHGGRYGFSSSRVHDRCNNAIFACHVRMYYAPV